MSGNLSNANINAKKASGIVIAKVRIANFRCLRKVEVRLKPLSILIGENNAGKSSFLDALHASIGNGPRTLNEEDIWTEDSEKTPPKTRTMTIDILIRPTDDKGKFVDEFKEGSPWLELWGIGVVQDDDDRDLVAIRTQLKWSAIKGEYVVERKFLREWLEDVANFEQAKPVQRIGQLTAIQLNPIAIYLLDAKRDAAEEMKARGSVWQRMISDPGLGDADIEEIERMLNEINDKFVANSGVLSHVKGHLAEVSNVVNCEKDNVAVAPVARRLRIE